VNSLGLPVAFSGSGGDERNLPNTSQLLLPSTLQMLGNCPILLLVK
jgi:hypothetical protein